MPAKNRFRAIDELFEMHRLQMKQRLGLDSVDGYANVVTCACMRARSDVKHVIERRPESEMLLIRLSTAIFAFALNSAAVGAATALRAGALRSTARRRTPSTPRRVSRLKTNSRRSVTPVAANATSAVAGRFLRPS